MQDIKKIDVGLNVTDWAKYTTPPEGLDGVAMIPFWLFELVRVYREQRIKRLCLAIAILGAALVAGGIVWAI